MAKRVFLIVLDSLGIGHAPDAAEFGDEGSNTLLAVGNSPKLNIPNLRHMGLFHIPDVELLRTREFPLGAFARLVEMSKGKDTTIGHWEMAGVESLSPLPVFPNGFPEKFLEDFSARTGRGWLCNQPYSGTDVIRDFGEEHMKTGKLIIYTSGDSVFQVAANEAVVPLEELYGICEMAREMLTEELAVGRVIARPFMGNNATDFKRTEHRHDFSLLPPAPTVLDGLMDAGKDVIGVGKIYDIFAGQGVSETIKTGNNNEGIAAMLELAKRDFDGLAYINLVDFDMLYGHRNDVDGYANALSVFDKGLGELLSSLRPDDVVMITADHGCDPSTPSTDHSRECVPFLAYGQPVAPGTNLGTQNSFGCVANTVAEYLGIPAKYAGKSLWPVMKKD